MDELTAAVVPGVEGESARDLVWAREDCRSDLMIARHRLSKLMLRQGNVWSGAQAWTGAHGAWLCQQGFAELGRQLAFESAYETVVMSLALRDGHDAAIAAMAADSGFAPLVVRLAHLRRISTLTALGLAVEIGDWHRLTGSSFGSYLGLTPTEAPSGASGSQRSLSNTDNTHARRLLVEAVWHLRRRNHGGRVMRNRW
jgi:transposase